MAARNACASSVAENFLARSPSRACANVSLVKVYTGTSILMIALVLTTVLLMIFPQIALWLPNSMR